MSDAVKRIAPVLEKFDSDPDKDRLYAIDPHLKNYVEDIKARLAECEEKKAYALHGAVRANTIHAMAEHEQITSKYTALMEQMLEGDYSDDVRSDVEKTISELDTLSENLRTILAKGNEQLEACDKLLTDPYLNERLKRDVKQYQNSILSNNSALSMHIADHTESKLCLLMTLADHDAKEQQGYEELKKWHASMKSLIEECRSVFTVHFEFVMREEAKEYLAPGNLSAKELSIRKQAAAEGQNQFEKIIRACEKRAAEYENLTQIAKDERLPLLLKEMAAKFNECIRNRECAAQMWTDKIQELELQKSA